MGLNLAGDNKSFAYAFPVQKAVIVKVVYEI